MTNGGNNVNFIINVNNLNYFKSISCWLFFVKVLVY
jgi:hypothetical protein